MAPAKKTILVVDDEIDFLNVLKKRLELKGFEVVTAYDASQAFEQLKAHRIDGAVIDIMMPGVDGLTLLKKIRETDTKLPIFIATAYSNEERFQAAMSANASGFIFKGDDMKKEVETIVTIVGAAGEVPGAGA